MIVKNETRKTVTWACFDNVNATATARPLKTGKIVAKEVKNFTPPKNETGRFYVLFSTEETNQPIASGTCGSDQVVCIKEVENSFCTQVVDSEVLSSVV